MKFIGLFIILLLSAQMINAQNQKRSAPLPPKTIIQQISADTPAMRRAIKLKADEVSNSLLNCEYEKMYDLMHPKVREFVGGRDAFYKLVGEGVRNLEVEGFTIISIENFEPTKTVSINQELFAVVPTKLKIKTPQGNLIQSAYDLAISGDKGQTWLFVGGSLGKESLEKLFPQIVGKLSFPESAPPTPEQ